MHWHLKRVLGHSGLSYVIHKQTWHLMKDSVLTLAQIFYFFRSDEFEAICFLFFLFTFLKFLLSLGLIELKWPQSGYFSLVLRWALYEELSIEIVGLFRLLRAFVFWLKITDNFGKRALEQFIGVFFERKECFLKIENESYLWLVLGNCALNWPFEFRQFWNVNTMN